jgi:hypothetical protein
MIKLAQRIVALDQGDYVIFLNKYGDRPQWQVVRLNDVKLEKP